MMPSLAEHSEEGDGTRVQRMGRAIARGIAIGLPVGLIALTLAIWSITSQNSVDSFVTALLPGILLCGFAGVAANMDGFAS